MPANIEYSYDYEIVNCSPELEKLIERTRETPDASRETRKNAQYPFAWLELGQSFTVPIVGTNETALRKAVSFQNTTKGNIGKYFKVKKHANYGVFEIGRIK